MDSSSRSSKGSVSPAPGPGGPRTTADKVRADKAYGSRGGRPRTFDEEDYKERRAWL
ncbi:hypothetical protein [Streptomyces sp. NPDC050121]|uniref:hypothetical protein n=1 Tax=Streptomyces sp. NPDC050121 TaxID=3365601 RepID=UPI00379CF0EA